MKKFILSMFFSFIFVAVFAKEMPCKVVGVMDGDTIKVLDSSNQQHKIRFFGIDTPEKKQAYGMKAKQALSKKIFNKNITIVYSKKDRYGRIIGKVYYNNRLINLEMVKEGHAWWYKHYCKDKKYSLAEQHARSLKSGLWSNSNAIPPWEWRRGKRSSSVKTSTRTQQQSQTPKKYWVNSSSHVIHNKSCRYYGKGKNGYYTNTPPSNGKDCKVCGGSKKQ